jgi:moderate conductance mechanosensitive channel
MTDGTSAAVMADAAGPAQLVDAAGSRLAEIAAAARAMIEDALATPGRFDQAARLLTDDGALGSLGDVLWPFASVLAAALVAAVIVFLLLAPARRRLVAASGATPLRSALLFVRRLAIDLAPPGVYLATASLLGRALMGERGLLFSGTEVFRTTAMALVTDSALAWIGAVLVVAPLGVGRPQLRLLPIGDSEASWARGVLLRIIVVGAGAWLLAETLYRVWLGDGAARLILIAATVGIAWRSLAALARIRPRLAGFARLWHALAIVSVFGLGAVWMLGLLIEIDTRFGRVLGTLAILVALPVADGLSLVALGWLKARFLARHEPKPRLIFVPAAAEGETLERIAKPLEGDERVAALAEMDRAWDAVVSVVHEAICVALAVIGTVLLARTWSIDLGALLGPHDARFFLGRVVDAAATLAVGWYAWRLFEATLGLRLARDGGGEQSRARTIQPLLRGVGQLVIGATALMGALSALGLNIAPLLASAGVVGIAVGFGAQTLVRDLFSGACYLAEDVFRIGDYIEGGNAKGTVEKITFRTVALRHQNGPLHFVPYGSLGTVRNNSRDWTIDKFEIPLPLSVESEAIRKMVKKIGQEMLQDEALRALIMQPLKAKLYRIDPGAKIFRCKVQTLPAKQFEVRAEAYRRIEAALAEAGVPFAEPTRVTDARDGHGEPRTGGAGKRRRRGRPARCGVAPRAGISASLRPTPQPECGGLPARGARCGGARPRRSARGRRRPGAGRRAGAARPGARSRCRATPGGAPRRGGGRARPAAARPRARARTPRARRRQRRSRARGTGD